MQCCVLISTYGCWLLISFHLMHIKLTKYHPSLTLVFIPCHNKWNIQRRQLYNKPFVCECRDTLIAHVILLNRLTRELVVNWKLCTHEVLSCCLDNLFGNKYGSFGAFEISKTMTSVFIVNAYWCSIRLFEFLQFDICFYG